MSKKILTRFQALLIIVIIVVAAIAIGLSAYFVAKPPTPPPKEYIKIGFTIATTGKYSFASLQGFRGITIWAEDVNARGGIYVKEYDRKLPIKLIYYDDRSDKTIVPKLYEKIIVEDEVDICIAPFSSTLTMVASAITEKYEKFCCIWAAASTSVYVRGYKYIISATQAPVDLYYKSDVEHMKHLGIKSVAIFYLDEPFPTAAAESVRKLCEQMGINVVFYEKYPSGLKDFTPILQKITPLNPDALFHCGYIGDQIMCLRQMKELGIWFKYINMHYSNIPHFYEALGDDALYIHGSTLWTPDVKWKVTVGMNTDEFIAAWKEKFPTIEPDYEGVLAYGAGVMLEQFILEAGSLDSDKLLEAAHKLSGKVVTIAGPYKIDERGRQLGCPYVVTQVQKLPTGEFKIQVVWPPEVAVAESIHPAPGWAER